MHEQRRKVHWSIISMLAHNWRWWYKNQTTRDSKSNTSISLLFIQRHRTWQIFIFQQNMDRKKKTKELSLSTFLASRTSRPLIFSSPFWLWGFKCKTSSPPCVLDLKIIQWINSKKKHFNHALSFYHVEQIFPDQFYKWWNTKTIQTASFRVASWR